MTGEDVIVTRSRGLGDQPIAYAEDGVRLAEEPAYADPSADPVLTAARPVAEDVREMLIVDGPVRRVAGLLMHARRL